MPPLVCGEGQTHGVFHYCATERARTVAENGERNLVRCRDAAATDRCRGPGSPSLAASLNVAEGRMVHPAVSSAPRERGDRASPINRGSVSEVETSHERETDLVDKRVDAGSVIGGVDAQGR